MTSFHEIFGSFIKTEKLTETSTVAAESPDNTETISVDLGKFGFYILTKYSHEFLQINHVEI